MRTILSSIIAICFCLNLSATNAYRVIDVPNPKNTNENCFVSNPDHILSDSAATVINKTAKHLKATVNVEVAVVAIDSIEGYVYDEFDFGVDLFNTWGIGDAKKNTGVLVFLVTNPHWIYIHTGDGMEGILNDAVCAEILQDSVYTLLKEENWDAGIVRCVNSIAEKVSTENAKNELLQEVEFKESIEPYTNYLAVSFIVMLIFLFFASRKMDKVKNLKNFEQYKSTRTMYGLMIAFAVIFPASMAFLAYWFKKQRNNIRKKSVKCAECGADMRLLSEAEEDEYLDTKEQCEEKVKSIDYDVWFCPHCGKYEIYPYPKATSSYTTCAKCGGMTCHQISNTIVSHATTVRSGEGIRTYLCEHCGQQTKIHYTIPIVPSPSGGGHSGGGGSWGGGHTSGGGAGGRF